MHLIFKIARPEQKGFDHVSFAKDLFDQGLYILNADGSKRPIRVSLDSVVLAKSDWTAIEHSAKLIFDASGKIVSKIYRNRAFSRERFESFSDDEWQAAQNGLPSRDLATVRYDGMIANKQLKFLELNTTIPAMQGYCDILNANYLRKISPSGKTHGTQVQKLQHSIESAFLNKNPQSKINNVAILCRKNDSQLGELNWIREVFQSHGWKTQIVHPEDVEVSGDKLISRGVEFDLIYRHIFLYSLRAHKELSEFCLNSSRVFNPPSAHWETKIIFAELSHAASSDRLAEEFMLTDDERVAINDFIPWSRVLTNQLAQNELVDMSRYVLKKSRSYGGKTVYIGKDYASRPEEWKKLLLDCLNDPTDSWMVQEFVQGDRFDLNWIQGQNAVQKSSCILDVSVFLYPGGGFSTGPVGRFSEHPIVNLGQGGGLIPIFFDA